MLAPNWYPGNRQLRQFAAACLPGFGLIGAAAHWKWHMPVLAEVFWIIGGVAFVLGLIIPRSVQPLYSLLMFITLPIGWLVSNILLRVIFYGILTPIGLVFRMTGRDALHLKRQQVQSYWKDRPQRLDLADYYRQS
jgi:polyferredoxin